jgi:hypothetical protein
MPSFDDPLWRASADPYAEDATDIRQGWAMTRDVDGNMWTRSSRCDASQCVQVSLGPGRVLVRSSGRPGGPALVFHPDDWRAFVALLKDESAR